MHRIRLLASVRLFLVGLCLGWSLTLRHTRRLLRWRRGRPRWRIDSADSRRAQWWSPCRTARSSHLAACRRSAATRSWALTDRKCRLSHPLDRSSSILTPAHGNVACNNWRWIYTHQFSYTLEYFTWQYSSLAILCHQWDKKKLFLQDIDQTPLTTCRYLPGCTMTLNVVANILLGDKRHEWLTQLATWNITAMQESNDSPLTLRLQLQNTTVPVYHHSAEWASSLYFAWSAATVHRYTNRRAL